MAAMERMIMQLTCLFLILSCACMINAQPPPSPGALKCWSQGAESFGALGMTNIDLRTEIMEIDLPDGIEAMVLIKCDLEGANGLVHMTVTCKCWNGHQWTHVRVTPKPYGSSLSDIFRGLNIA